MKLAIIGSRNCPQMDLAELIEEIPSAIISGGAKGADTLAREFAHKHGLQLIEFLPEYDRYGRSAPLVRNRLIVENCDCLMALWDSKSRGTKYTIDYAIKLGKPVKIVGV